MSAEDMEVDVTEAEPLDENRDVKHGRDIDTKRKQRPVRSSEISHPWARLGWRMGSPT